MLSLAKIKLEKIFIKENAGSPKEKYNKAFAEFFKLIWSKDPYPNKEDTICSLAIINPNVAGKLKNIDNYKDLSWIFFMSDNFFCWIYFDNFGSIITPIAMPAIAKFIWYILSA